MSAARFVEKNEYMETYSIQALYSPYEKWKINQFMFGLRGEIEHIVAHQRFDTYEELLQQCYVADNSLKKIHIYIEREINQGRVRRTILRLANS